MQRSYFPLLAFSLITCFCFTSTAIPAPALEADTSFSAEGYFVLRWESVEDSVLYLQQDTDQSFSDLEQWEVTNAGQFTQSGLVNDTYFYRLQDSGGNSNVVEVEVRHHSLQRAALFFTTGAILFCVLLATIISGNRRHMGDTMP